MTELARRGITVFPAIDLRGGRCVRLQQGSADRQTVYSPDPFSVAAEFAALGAEWIHVVDLDAAFGEGSNRRLISELARSTGVRIQTGGGIRRDSDLEEVLSGAVSRAVLGTAAVENPDLVARAIANWGSERIAVGLDARGRTPAVRGWTEEAAEDLFEIGTRLAGLGVSTFIYTDISRDGMLAGPNVATSGDLAAATGADVIVSGGVGTLQHLEEIRDCARSNPGIVGVIVGKAIYERRIDLAEALRIMTG